MQPQPTIGVFDSGFGGLTVLRSLLQLLPHADYLYLGDSARLPYGSKSQATIARYAVESAHFLESHGASFLVIACNTASALAIDEIRAAVRIPVLGVIETGADAAHAASRTRDVLVLATTATVQSHAYARANSARGLRTIEKACPLLVPLVEEGWTDSPAHTAITLEVLRIYLDEAFAQAGTDAALNQSPAFNPDTLVLGCTHYPLLLPLLTQVLHERAANNKNSLPNLKILDSAEATAQRVRQLLTPAAEAPASTNFEVAASPLSPAKPHCRFYATDSVEKFQTLGARFLGQPIHNIQLIDLGG